MFNPAKASDAIKKEYIGYIGTTFHFKKSEIQNQLMTALDETVSNGPFVEMKDAFRSGLSIDDLIKEGVLSPLFRELEIEKNAKGYHPKLPITRPLYLHQEKAVRKIVEGKNVVVSTGTGSGKTNCFLIPVINELLREKEAGTLENDGVRAMFIYPMNALANDQIKGLREILMLYPDIKFGVYNGGTENNEETARKLYEAMYAHEKYPELRSSLPNERLSRDDMKKHPPHILFTNYAMLEHMLLRPGDDVIFSNSNFKYVVLDEGHVYVGATGIETAFLMGRLKARVSGTPQFIITSATLGDGSLESNKMVCDFAERLTGCPFGSDDVITGCRERYTAPAETTKHPDALWLDLAGSMSGEENFFADTLNRYKILYNKDQSEAEILYNLLTNSWQYARMRELESPINFCDFARELGFHQDVAVAFIALCAKARKCGKALVDIRYHYFLRALDGCYIAIDDIDSLSLTRKEYSDASRNQKMFEIGVCDDCGEIVLLGKTQNGKLEFANSFEEIEYYQFYVTETDNDIKQDEEAEPQKSPRAEKLSDEYMLCKSCGAIVPLEEQHNKWCECGNTKAVKLKKLNNANCSICKGEIRRFNLGYESATSVIATSLYEHIPEYTYVEKDNSATHTTNLFLKTIRNKKQRLKTGSQFLVFSDSRQGAAKFACYLEDSYNEFLRRRGIWNVADNEEAIYPNGINVSDFVKLLENFYSEKKLFRKSNDPNAISSIVDNRRNAWIALLNELYSSNRRTSLVSLGKLQFDYLGNTPDICQKVAETYGLTKDNAKAFLDYLIFEVVKSGAIITDKDTDINDEDREYLFRSTVQQGIVKNRTDGTLKNVRPWMPTARRLKNKTTAYYRNNKLEKVMAVLKLSSEKAVEFLGDYWEYLISSDVNPYALVTKDSKVYYLPAKTFNVKIGNNAAVFKCTKCGKITQFNIGGHCIQNKCDGNLIRLSVEDGSAENYYELLYKNARIAPLFIKEHTAQLAKKEALEYQQQFIRKEINALSCSTTFEMGVDVGDLETVFLRNFPPLPSNYAQRVGRAGRSIDAAAFALTYARLSSHDFTFFYNPKEMISGKIYPPQFSLENEKILKRHIYAVALSLYLKKYPDLYDGNSATAFVINKGYQRFFEWLESKPTDLQNLLNKSFSGIKIPSTLDFSTFAWADGLCGEKGILKKLIAEYENDINYLEKEHEKAMRNRNESLAVVFTSKLERYKRNELIDMLVRGNVLPKYGFPVDSVELSQNISTKDFKSLNLSRDLSVAIAEYAPSAEIVADGGLYTSRYIRKPFVNHKEFDKFDVAYIAECKNCHHVNYRTLPVGIDSVSCAICGAELKQSDFSKSIEPRSGFIAEKDVLPVPLSSQERKYKTEAIYIGDKNAYPIENYKYRFGNVDLEVESTANDSLVVKSTIGFYVCEKCGYAIAEDEISKLNSYDDYKPRGLEISRPKIKKSVEHDSPFGKGKCENIKLKRHLLHHEFKTDVAKITFHTNTEDTDTMLSVMYALLNAFAQVLSIERRDISACLTYKIFDGKMSHKIIIYDAVPGGAGHSRRLVTQDGEILRRVIQRAVYVMSSCKCEPSCYNCLRNYENQKIHERLDRKKALQFLMKMV